MKDPDTTPRESDGDEGATAGNAGDSARAAFKGK
jgi:hypothetical protein